MIYSHKMVNHKLRRRILQNRLHQVKLLRHYQKQVQVLNQRVLQIQSHQSRREPTHIESGDRCMSKGYFQIHLTQNPPVSPQ